MRSSSQTLISCSISPDLMPCVLPDDDTKSTQRKSVFIIFLFKENSLSLQINSHIVAACVPIPVPFNLSSPETQVDFYSSKKVFRS